MKRKLILDIGSCHGNDLALARDLVQEAYAEGVRSIKFQLFPWKKNDVNTFLDRNIFSILAYEAPKDLEIFASVWEKEDINLMCQLGIKTFKLAHSQRDNNILIDHILEKVENPDIYVSYSYLNIIHPKVIPILCIPEYPVTYKVDFSFPMLRRFKGFSDHTLGIEQTKKAFLYTDVVEKHYKGSSKFECPDSLFAIDKDELRFIMAYLRIIGSYCEKF